jgi:hypothetical protein
MYMNCNILPKIHSNRKVGLFPPKKGRCPYFIKGLAHLRKALREADPIPSLITHLFHADGVDKLVIVFVCLLLRVKEIDNDCNTVIKPPP